MAQLQHSSTMPITPHATPTHESWPAPSYGTVLAPNDHDYSDASITNRIAWLHLELGCLKQRIRWLEDKVEPFLHAQNQTIQQLSKLEVGEGEGSPSDELDAFFEEFTNGQYHEQDLDLSELWT